MWAGPAIVLFVQTIVFYIRHHKMDDEVYMLEQNIDEDSQPPATESGLVEADHKA